MTNCHECSGFEGFHAPNCPMGVDVEEPTVTGRLITPDNMVCSIHRDRHGTLHLRIDDISRPEFWMEIKVPQDSIIQDF